ncbi:MAG TPA: hypothetical protein DCF68_20270 [Cyanothece sp. UBA12306]|nr:hypothetical protein [Cyanothece sp. UBA12306]
MNTQTVDISAANYELTLEELETIAGGKKKGKKKKKKKGGSKQD